MRCREFRDLSELLRDGALGTAEAAEARAHLGSCEACRGFEADAALVLAPLDSLPPGPYLAPGNPWRTLPPWAGGSATAIGIVLALLGVGGAAAFGLFGGPRPPSAAGEGDRPEVVALPSGAVEVGAATGPSVPEESPADPPLPAGAYSGKVVAEDGTPVAGASVEVAGAPRTSTDSAGLFTVGGLAPGGSRLLRLAAPGCVPLEALLPPLRPGTTTILAAIPVGPARATRVRVVGPDGGPAAGARVRAVFAAASRFPDSRPTYAAGNGVESLPISAEAAAGPDGIARFPGLGPGNWTFLADAPGCAPSRPATGAALLTLEPAAVLVGRVVDDEGRPCGGAEIAWVRSADRVHGEDLRYEGRGRAGPDGRFRLEGVPASPLLMRVRTAGAMAWAPAGAVDPGVTPRVFLRAPAYVEARGLVVDGEGRPVPGIVLLASVRVPGLASAGSDFVPVRTDSSGRFRIPEAPAEGTVMVGPLRGGGWSSDPDSRSLVLRPGGGADAPPFRTRVLRAGSVEGEVVDADGRPRPGMEVDALIPRGDGLRLLDVASSGRTDASGRFRLDGVAAGSALVVARDVPPEGAPPLDFSRLAEVLESSIDAPGRVEVAAGGTARVRVSPSADTGASKRPGATVRVRGSVRSADGTPAPGVRVFALPGDARLPSFMLRLPYEAPLPCGPDGRFDGEVALPIAPPPGSAFPFLVLAFARDGRTGSVETKIGEGTGEIPLVLEEGRTLEGRVLEPDGSPAAGALIDAVSEDEGQGGFLMPRACTGPDGSFRMRGLPAGDIAVFVARPGRPVVRLAVADDEGPSVELRIPGIVTVRGRIAAPGGTPVAGLPVRWSSRAILDPPRGTRAAADGSFEFPDVPDVPFRIESGSSDPDLDPGAVVQEVRLFEAGAAAADVEVLAAAAIEGVVEDADGRPGAGAVVGASYSREGRTWFRGAMADSRGRFRVTGLPPGTDVDLRAHLAGFQASTKAAPGGEPATLRLPGGIDAASSAALIEGRVLGAYGHGVPPMQVRLLTEEGVVLDSCSTGLSGGFVLSGFRGGRFSVEADPGDGDCLYADGVVPGAGEVVLRRGGPPGRMRGRAVGEDGSPAAEVPVTALRLGAPSPWNTMLPVGWPRIEGPEGTVRRGTTAADGTFDLGSPAGRWVLLAGTPGTARVPAAAISWDAASPDAPDLRLGSAWTLRLQAPGAATAIIGVLGLLPDDAPPLRLHRFVPASGLIEVSGLPRAQVEVVLRGADGRECARVRVEPRPADSDPLEVTLRGR